MPDQPRMDAKARKAREVAEEQKRALLIVDFINLFDFDGWEKLAARAVPAARRTALLKKKLRADGVPCIYANDNFGHWRSEFSRLVDECIAKGGPAAEIAKILEPGKDDYAVLKPRHSAFFGTPLEFLLEELGVNSLVITGLSADICVFATAQDAYIRKFRIWIPADCVAADTAEHEAQSLDHLARTMKAQTAGTDLDAATSGTDLDPL